MIISNVLIKKVRCQGSSINQYVFFKQGEYSTPLAILEEQEVEFLIEEYKEAKGEK